MGEQSGFGPTEPAATGVTPFSVTGPTTLTLDAHRAGTASFVVTNVSGRPVRARPVPQPMSGADAAWLSVAGEPERPLGVAATATVEVRVEVPAAVPAGQHALRLDVSAEDRPDLVTTGQTVQFVVPAPAAKRIPTWVIPVVVVAILVLGGGAWAITRFVGGSDPEPTASPTPTPAGPVAVAPPTLTGDAVVGSTLTVTEGTWQEPVTRFWVWQTCPVDPADPAGADPQGCADLVTGTDGSTVTATGPTHVVAAAEEGVRLRVVESAFAGSPSGTDVASRPLTSQVSVPTAAVGPAPPEPVTVADVRGRPLSVAGDILGGLGFSVLVTQVGSSTDCDPVVDAQNPVTGALPPGSSIALTTLAPPTRCYVLPDWGLGGGFLELPDFLSDLGTGP